MVYLPWSHQVRHTCLSTSFQPSWVQRNTLFIFFLFFCSFNEQNSPPSNRTNNISDAVSCSACHSWWYTDQFPFFSHMHNHVLLSSTQTFCHQPHKEKRQALHRRAIWEEKKAWESKEEIKREVVIIGGWWRLLYTHFWNLLWERNIYEQIGMDISGIGSVRVFRVLGSSERG